jgi:hypothetical protein
MMPLLKRSGKVRWCISVIPALRRLRQEDGEFKASLNSDRVTKKD